LIFVFNIFPSIHTQYNVSQLARATFDRLLLIKKKDKFEENFCLAN